MKVIVGRVMNGAGLASRTLAYAEARIAERTGLSPLVRGTLDLGLEGAHHFTADVIIPPKEGDGFGAQFLLLQACLVHGPHVVIGRKVRIPACLLLPVLEPAAPYLVTRIAIVSNYHLRSILRLMTGDRVGVEVDIDQEEWIRAIHSSGGLVEVGRAPGI